MQNPNRFRLAYGQGRKSEPARLTLARLRRLHPSPATSDAVRSPGPLDTLPGRKDPPALAIRRAQYALSGFQDEDLAGLAALDGLPRDRQY